MNGNRGMQDKTNKDTLFLYFTETGIRTEINAFAATDNDRKWNDRFPDDQTAAFYDYGLADDPASCPAAHFIRKFVSRFIAVILSTSGI